MKYGNHSSPNGTERRSAIAFAAEVGLEIRADALAHLEFEVPGVDPDARRGLPDEAR